MWRIFSIGVGVCIAAVESLFAAAPASPLTAEESLSHFQLPAGLRIEVVACEPEVVDPVDARFDERGRLWVAEMRDYPFGANEGEPARSRIRLLEDRDQNGSFETAGTFAEQLPFVNGIQPWRGGVLVTLAGAVAYLPDENGDGRADGREVWYGGFAEENSQLRASNPRWNLDQRIYVANGLRGGQISNFHKPDEAPFSLNGMDFCFDPLTGAAEAVSGMGQFGMTFFNGQRFVCTNRNPLIHIVLEDRYLKRNPALAVARVARDVAPSGEASRLFPRSRAWTTSNLHAGQFSAACGVRMFDSDRLGTEFTGAAFVCEPTSNLVHCEIVSPDGATFSSRPVFAGSEFLTSDDDWFRPVNLEVGPDGALYIVDMYRAVIEHPDWMPDELRGRADLYFGNDRGRIYRVVRNGAEKIAAPQLSAASDDELAALFDHSIGWWRDTAARLLYERQSRTIGPKLAELARDSRYVGGRIQSLWTLRGLNQLTPPVVLQGLNDAQPVMRAESVRLSETWLNSSHDVFDRVTSLADDANQRVRFQVALSLGEVQQREAVMPALELILWRDAASEWSRSAVFSSLRPSDIYVLMSNAFRIRLANQPVDEAKLTLVRELAKLAGHQSDTEAMEPVVRLIARAQNVNERFRFAAIVSLAESERGRKELAHLLQERTESVEGLAPLTDRASSIATDGSRPSVERIEAIQFLQLVSIPDSQTLQSIAESDQDLATRIAAIRAMSTGLDDATARRWLVDLAEQSAGVRAALLDATVGHASAALELLAQIERGEATVVELGPTIAERLKKHSDPHVREQWGALAAAQEQTRAAKLTHAREALAIDGDARRGQAVFAKHCATCHRIDKIGVDVAPDISDSRVATAEKLLTDILEPNRAIDANYISYTVVTRDGLSLVGVLGAETSTSLTVKLPGGKTESVLRREIDTIRSNGVSLMPEGWERELTHQELADLVSFIKNWRYLEDPPPVGESSQPVVP